MILFSGPALVLYFLIGLGGIIYLAFRIVKKAGKMISGEKPKDSWLQDELDTFKDKKRKM